MRRAPADTRIREGRRRGGPPSPARGIALAAALLAWPLASSVGAQTVLPEQRLSTTNSNLFADPQLRAAGTRVFGAWGGLDAPPTAVSYGYSVDRGETWVNEAALPLAIPPDFGAKLPFALAVSANGVVDMAVDGIGHFHNRRSAFELPSWTPAVLFGYEGGWPDELPSIATNPEATAVYATFTRRATYSGTIWFLHSLDAGQTWSPHLDLSSPNCSGSSMVVAPDGTLYVTWIDYALGQVLLRKSGDQGATFTPPVAIATPLNNLNATPLGWQDPPGTYTLRRYPYYRDGVHLNAAPNFPALAVDRSDGPTRGTLYLVWADHAEGAPAPAATTHAEAEPNDEAGAAQLVTLDGDIDGYLWAGGHTGPSDEDWYAFDAEAGETIVLDGITTSVYGNGCRLYERLPDGRLLKLGHMTMLGSQDVSDGAHAKPPIFTLPRTGRYLLQLLGNSLEAPYYRLSLRRYQLAPGSVARDMRDIVLIRSSDGGQTWSQRVRVNSDPAGADQHQPNVAVDEQGRVYVAWYDRRDSEFGDEVIPYAAVSADGGATFGPDLRLTSVASRWTGLQPDNSEDDGGLLIGDRIAIAAGDDFGMVAWTDLRVGPNFCDVYGARIVDVPTAVAAVSDLIAEPAGETVRLRWRINDAGGLTAIDVLRAAEGVPEQPIGSAALTGAEGEAEYRDEAVEPGRTYTYRLRVTLGGTSYHLGPVAVTTPARIEALAWRAAGPNPFAQRASVTLAVPREDEALVRVYDVQGKVVRTLHEGPLAAGERRLEWDGRDAAGAETAPGLYFVAAQVGAASVRTKLTRVR